MPHERLSVAILAEQWLSFGPTEPCLSQLLRLPWAPASQHPFLRRIIGSPVSPTGPGVVTARGPFSHMAANEAEKQDTPWIIERQNYPECLLCGKWALGAHCGSKDHRRNVRLHGPAFCKDPTRWVQWAEERALGLERSERAQREAARHFHFLRAQQDTHDRVDRDPQEPWLVLRQGQRFCAVCDSWADQPHIDSPGHKLRVGKHAWAYAEDPESWDYWKKLDSLIRRSEAAPEPGQAPAVPGRQDSQRRHVGTQTLMTYAHGSRPHPRGLPRPQRSHSPSVTSTMYDTPPPTREPSPTPPDTPNRAQEVTGASAGSAVPGLGSSNTGPSGSEEADRPG